MTDQRSIASNTSGSAPALAVRLLLLASLLPLTGRALAYPFDSSPTALQLEGAEREQAAQCLATAVVYEAGDQSLAGQEAVAQVILNRLHHPAFPKTLCGVVYQGSQRRTGCQFTFTCDGSLAFARRDAVWSSARNVAERALDGLLSADIGQSTFYHAKYVAPVWAPRLTKVSSIGAHIFYRFPGRDGLPEAFSSVHQGSEFDVNTRPAVRTTARNSHASNTTAAPGVFAIWGLTAAVLTRRGNVIVVNH